MPDLDGTELAISESQERMAVVVAPSDVKTFLGYAAEENLEAVEVAVVTEDPRLFRVERQRNCQSLQSLPRHQRCASGDQRCSGYAGTGG